MKNIGNRWRLIPDLIEESGTEGEKEKSKSELSIPERTDIVLLWFRVLVMLRSSPAPKPFSPLLLLFPDVAETV
jgi:hypothetical protein